MTGGGHLPSVRVCEKEGCSLSVRPVLEVYTQPPEGLTLLASRNKVSVPSLGMRTQGASVQAKPFRNRPFLLPVSWDIDFGTQPPCSEEARAAPWRRTDSQHVLPATGTSRLGRRSSGALPESAQLTQCGAQAGRTCWALPKLQTHEQNH